MIHSYIAELQNRVDTIHSLLGELPEDYQSQVKSAKQKVDQIISKIITGKDIQHKYNKLSAFINKHNDVLDTMLTPDKINIVLDELDELKEIAESLNTVEKLLPALDTSEYTKHKPKYQRIEILNTASQVKLNSNNDTLEIVNYSETTIKQLQQEQRSEMNSIIELNYRMLNNLNQKIKLASERKQKK